MRVQVVIVRSREHGSDRHKRKRAGTNKNENIRMEGRRERSSSFFFLPNLCVSRELARTAVCKWTICLATESLLSYSFSTRKAHEERKPQIYCCQHTKKFKEQIISQDWKMLPAAKPMTLTAKSIVSSSGFTPIIEKLRSPKRSFVVDAGNDPCEKVIEVSD